MDQNEIVRLAFQVDSTQATKAAAEIAKLKAATDTYSVSSTIGVTSAKKLAEATGQYAVQADHAATAAKAYAASVQLSAAAQARIAMATTTATTNASAAGVAMTTAAKSTINYGQAGLQAGRMIQDFTQGGIGGILNNLEGAAMALGGGPGLAGLLTAVGVAAFIAKPFIAGLFDGEVRAGFDGAKTRVENLTDKIKELTDRPHKLQIDLNELHAAEADLAKITEGLAAYNAARGLKSKAATTAGGAIDQVLAESPKSAQGLMDSVRQSIGNDLASKDSALEAARKELRWAEASKAKGELDPETALRNASGDIDRGAAKHRLSGEDDAMWVARATEAVNAASEAIFDPTKGAAAVKLGQLKQSDPKGFADALAKAGHKTEAEKIRNVSPEVIAGEAAMREGMEKEEKMRLGILAAEKVQDDKHKAILDYERKFRADIKKWAEEDRDKAKKDLDDERKLKRAMAEVAFKQGHEGRSMAEEKARLEKVRETTRDSNQADSNALMGRMEDASGLLDPIMRMQYMARMRRMNDRGFQQRQAGRSFADREKGNAIRNKWDDEELEKQATRALLGQGGPATRSRRVMAMRGVTRDPNLARQMAKDLVARGRAARNGETGDQPLKENTVKLGQVEEKIGKLTTAMEKLERSGVVVRLD